MKKIYTALLLVLLSCSKAQLPNAVEEITVLRVAAISPNGDKIDSCEVFLNGKPVGLTPLVLQEVQHGILPLRITKPGFRLYTDRIQIIEGEFHSIEAVLDPLPPDQGELLVTVNQDSALITVKDSREKVIAQLAQQEATYVLPPGGYIVIGEKAGFSRAVQATEVLQGASTIVNLELKNLLDSPPTLEFAIQPDTVQFGEAFELTWQSNGTQVIIDQGVGVRGPAGAEKIVCETAGLKKFTATAYSASNSITQAVDSVYVRPEQTEQIDLDFNVVPDTAVAGERFVITWHANALHVIIDQGVGIRGPSGSEEVSFQTPGMKVLVATAYGSSGQMQMATDSVQIEPAPLPDLPVLLLSASRYVNIDSTATISWAAQNADYVVVDFVENAGLQGSAAVTFATAGIRLVTATAYNPAGYVSATDTIEVVAPVVQHVDDIILPAQAVVLANQGRNGSTDANAGLFRVDTAGRYRILAETWYNSGDSQLNESYFLLLRDSAGIAYGPLDPNAGVYKVVADEPGAPHLSTKDAGTFSLSAGTYTIELHHYAEISALYPRFLNSAMSGPESIKLLGFKISFLDQ